MCRGHREGPREGNSTNDGRRAVSLCVASSPSLSLDGVVTVRFDVRLARAARMSTAVWCRNRVEKRNPPSSHRTTARRKTTTISVPSLPSPRQTWWTLIHTHAHVSVSTAVVVAYYLRVVRVVVAARALHEWYHHLCVALRPRTRVFFSILQSRVRNFPFFFFIKASWIPPWSQVRPFAAGPISVLLYYVYIINNNVYDTWCVQVVPPCESQ